jgi:mRNA interferase RelE/StbE
MYRVELTRQAQKQLNGLPAPIQQRIAAKLRALQANPRPDGSLKLTADEGHRVKVGDYRIKYLIDDDTHLVTVTKLGPRQNFY